MNIEVILAFVAVGMVSVLSPGPAVALALRNGASHGLRAAVWSSAGNVFGLFLLSTAAMAGIGALLMSSALAFGVAKVLGAAYLIWLGIRQWRLGVSVMPGAVAQASVQPRGRALMREGFLVALTNPKAILFFSALFPQFLDRSAPLMPQFLILTTLFMLLSFAALNGYAATAARTRGLITHPRVARWAGRLFGGVFVGFGVAMLALRRPAT